MLELQTGRVMSHRAWVKICILALWLATGVIALTIALSSVQELPLLETALGPLKQHIKAEKVLYSPLAYFCLLTLVFALERRRPVRKQAFFSPSFWQDALWYPGSMLFRLVFLGAYVALLQTIYEQYFSFLTIRAISDWQPLWKFLLAVFATDLLRWVSHLIRHKVPVFWAFHAVHHSQKNMNLFTDARVHPVDRMISSTLRFLPMLMLGNEMPVILLWAIFETIYPKFYHANIRLNMGPLRYIFVTPQSHRVHHASGRAYRDKNFGFTFSIWDRIFGTYYHDDFDYPVTGVDGGNFPGETNGAPLSQAKTFLQLLIHPFIQVFRIQKQSST